MRKTIHTDAVELMFDAMQTLKTKEDYYAFFEDLCTVKEVLSMAQRVEVAYQLEQGRTYIEVTNDTGASTATISRVNRIMNYGTDGLKNALSQIPKEEAEGLNPEKTEDSNPEEAVDSEAGKQD